MSDLITAEEAERFLCDTESGPVHWAGLDYFRDFARTVIALHAQLADAKAAQAMVVRKAAEACEDVDFAHDDPNIQRMVREVIGFAGSRVRALADADGLAMVQELRARAAAARWNVDEAGDLVRLCRGDHEKGEDCGAHEDRFVPEADRDRLAAEKAELEARVEKLVGALNYYADPRAYCSDCTNALDKGARARAALSNLTHTPFSDLRENGHIPHEFYGSARTGCRECGHGQDHPIHTNRAAKPDTPTPSDTDGPIWHERLGWDGNKEGEG